MGLERKLEEVTKARIETFQKENTTSQPYNTQFKANIDRTVEALFIAEAAGMEVVHREHDDVSRAALKGHLIQVESEQTRAAHAKKAAVEERDFFKACAEK